MSTNYTNFSQEALSILNAEGVNPDLIKWAAANVVRNDVAHHFEHINSVIINASVLSDEYDVREEYRKNIVTGAMLHDIACWINRDVHELLGAYIVGTVNFREKFNIDGHDAYIISRIIAEHRASYTGNRPSIESFIVALADRGTFAIEELLRRSYLYGRSNLGLQGSEAVFHCVNHIRDKFGLEGYALSDIPETLNIDITTLQHQAQDVMANQAIVNNNKATWELNYDDITHVINSQSPVDIPIDLWKGNTPGNEEGIITWLHLN